MFDQLEDAMRDVQLPEYLANSRFHKGSYEGLRAWGICQLVRVGAAPATKAGGKAGAKGKGGKGKKGEEEGREERTRGGGAAKEGKVGSLTVKRFYRPEDISREQAYKAGSYYEVYASGESACGGQGAFRGGEAGGGGGGGG